MKILYLALYIRVDHFLRKHANRNNLIKKYCPLHLKWKYELLGVVDLWVKYKAWECCGDVSAHKNKQNESWLELRSQAHAADL